jgi:hypothetical protein
MLEQVHTCLPARLLKNIHLFPLLIGRTADFVSGKSFLFGNFVRISDFEKG